MRYIRRLECPRNRFSTTMAVQYRQLIPHKPPLLIRAAVTPMLHPDPPLETPLPLTLAYTQNSNQPSPPQNPDPTPPPSRTTRMESRQGRNAHTVTHASDSYCIQYTPTLSSSHSILFPNSTASHPCLHPMQISHHPPSTNPTPTPPSPSTSHPRKGKQE